MVMEDRISERVFEAACIARTCSRQVGSYFCPLHYIEDVLRLEKKCDLYIVGDYEIDDPAMTFLQAKTIHVKESVYRSARANHPDDRYIVAHELGHVLMHYYVDARKELENAAFTISHKREVEANAFAREVLAPQEALLKMMIKIKDEKRVLKPEVLDKEMADIFCVPLDVVHRQRQYISHEAKKKCLDDLHFEAVSRRKEIEQRLGRV